MKVGKQYSECSVFLIGIELNCPLCGILVKSGISHICSQPKKQKKQERKKREAE